ncbi:MAG: FtsX-like permease family protein [Candidatus Methanoliparum thermophilum]|uniref:FtsX-like permease family protein n=1 Tax=Methanoliparum thermophilum TaxID=2491083 RepID=A0A520KTL7_METT2|nr:FtsX-like permease family protein [Candidatus Methanoliparum sp. LAM-1]RZN65390.1 MAG: FtsX-like permease family protein [Candidatus Methanoliparum thermophilum]BDC35522.1 hypothetical protein MTLP_02040 [Candidatus Methanoliparum sp. LAM-1]
MAREYKLRMHNVAYKNLFGRKFRSILLLFAIMIAVALFFGLSSLTAGMEELMMEATNDSGIKNAIDVVDSSSGMFYGTIDRSAIKTIESIPGVKYVIPRVFALVQLEDVDLVTPLSQIERTITPEMDMLMQQMIRMIGTINIGETDFSDLSNLISLVGIDPDLEYIMGGYPSKITRGSIFTTSGGAILGEMLAKNSGLDVGDKITVICDNKQRTFYISGIYSSGNPIQDNSVVVSIKDAQYLKGFGNNEVSLLRVISEENIDNSIIGMHIKTKLPGKVNIIDHSLTASVINEQFNQFKVYEYIVIAIVILASIGFILAITMRSITERTKEIGTLRAIGWQKTDVLRLIFIESLIITIIGSILGVILGILLPYIFQTIIPFFFSDLIIPPMSELVKITPLMVVESILIGCTAGVIGGMIPSIRAVRMSPVDAFKY